MIRLRQWSALLLPIMLAPALQAQDKPTSPWAIDRSLSVSPQSAPVLALKYRLLPLNSELKEGNAVPIYLRLVHEQNDATRKYWTETPKPWNGMPVDKIPLDEARRFLQDHRRLLRQFDLGARRRTAEWNYTLDEGNFIGILMPDTQQMRNYAPMLILQARVAIAEGDFARAAHHLETGFAVQPAGRRGAVPHQQPGRHRPRVAIRRHRRRPRRATRRPEPLLGAHRPASPTHRPAAGPGPRISVCPVGVSRVRRPRPRADRQSNGTVSCGASGRSSAVFGWKATRPNFRTGSPRILLRRIRPRSRPTFPRLATSSPAPTACRLTKSGRCRRLKCCSFTLWARVVRTGTIFIGPRTCPTHRPARFLRPRTSGSARRPIPRDTWCHARSFPI